MKIDFSIAQRWRLILSNLFRWLDLYLTNLRMYAIRNWLVLFCKSEENSKPRNNEHWIRTHTYIWAASFASLACMSLISVPAGSTFQSTWVILFIYHYTNIFLNSTGLFLGLQQMFKDIIGSIFPIFSITHSHRSQCGTFVFIVIYKIAILSEKLQPYLLSSHCDWRDSLGRYFIFWGYLAYSQAVEALNIKKNLFLGC